MLRRLGVLQPELVAIVFCNLASEICHNCPQQIQVRRYLHNNFSNMDVATFVHQRPKHLICS